MSDLSTEYRGLSIAFNSCWESKDSEISFQHREVRRKSDKCITQGSGGGGSEAESAESSQPITCGIIVGILGTLITTLFSRSLSSATTRIWFRLNAPQTLAQSSPQGAWTRGRGFPAVQGVELSGGIRVRPDSRGRNPLSYHDPQSLAAACKRAAALDVTTHGPPLAESTLIRNLYLCRRDVSPRREGEGHQPHVISQLISANELYPMGPGTERRREKDALRKW